jgi:hypothetical protein
MILIRERKRKKGRRPSIGKMWRNREGKTKFGRRPKEKKQKSKRKRDRATSGRHSNTKI